MLTVPANDPVGALVPHTLKEPMPGKSSGPLAGRSFMVKDLFAIKGHKVCNGNPDWYAAASAGDRDRACHSAPARCRRDA